MKATVIDPVRDVVTREPQCLKLSRRHDILLAVGECRHGPIHRRLFTSVVIIPTNMNHLLS